MSVPYDIMGDTQGHNICQSLYLMDDSISVGHFAPVIHSWGTMCSDHLVNLLMDLGCKMAENIPEKGTENLMLAVLDWSLFVLWLGGTCA